MGRIDPIQQLGACAAPRLASVTPLFGSRHPADSNPLALARVAGAIHTHSGALAADLEDAIATWLELHESAGAARSEPFRARSARLRTLFDQLSLGPYEPDPRD